MTEIGADDFARRFSQPAASLMCLLGAGASASAGIPTAGDMTWAFKQELCISQRRMSRQSVADLSSPAIRSQLQAHIDSCGNLLRRERRTNMLRCSRLSIQQKWIGGPISTPSWPGRRHPTGHVALATLMRAHLTRMVWTTNFDSLVADACAKVYDATGPLTTVALDAPDLAAQCITAERWLVEIKLHGDFRSRRLKS